MHSFLRTVASLRGREAAVKESLLTHLSDSVHEIQLEHLESQGQDKVDDCSPFCTVLEAIFIHGLKGTFMNRVTRAIGSDPDQHPEPSFWEPLLIFSHRGIVDQINMLSLITSDVGRCRAWLRLALNDCLLSSYLEAMRQDASALRPYYRHSAFVRDAELLDVAQRLIEGIETCSFSVACNSSLLNVWTNPPLLLAGLWMPTLRSCPITAGVDVASTLNDDESTQSVTEDSASSIVSLSSTSGIGQIIALNEDEALKIILGTPVNEAPSCVHPQRELANIEQTDKKMQPPKGRSQNTDIPVRSDDGSERVNCDEDGPSSLGNSLIGRVGWSSSFEEVPGDGSGSGQNLGVEKGEHVMDKRRTQSVTGSLRTPTDVQSYKSLLESYNLLSGAYIKTPDTRDFFQRFEGTSDTSANFDSTGPAEDPEFGILVQQLGKLAKEPGLDVQNYACKGCARPIGMGQGKARVCAFSGGYYCPDCHSGEEWVIPARVIHNWDFRRYPVSRKSAAFLDEVQHHPLLDLKVLNPTLYLAVEEMTHLQALRHQLNLLRAYLFTCREPVIEDLQKRVWPREYLYEHVHLYSVADLLQIPSGALAHLLQKVVSFARNHVLGCWLCSQKGFICEICSSPKVIYPFDMETTYRCGVCSAVFHTGCLDATKPCPKCKRRQEREDIPLLEAVDP